MSTHQRIAFLFPGQGAQVVGMGKDFCEAFALARETFEEANSILNRHLSKVVFEGPIETLTETRNSQTGIYVTSLAILRVLQKQFPTLRPSVCAGLSLGEYTALTASERIPFETCLPLVQSRGEAMNEACEAIAGTMAAIFGLAADETEEMVKSLKLPNDLWVANFNCPGQTVISGTLKGVEAGMEAAKARGAKRVIPLRVHGAFHSGLMQRAQENLAPQLRAIMILESPIDIVMNVPGGYVRETRAIRDYLTQQVTQSVRWEQGIRAMTDVDLFIEIGCGKTLSGLNKQIGVSAPTVNVNQLTDLETLSKII